jgi:hypothetical protein
MKLIKIGSCTYIHIKLFPLTPDWLMLLGCHIAKRKIMIWNCFSWHYKQGAFFKIINAFFIFPLN